MSPSTAPPTHDAKPLDAVRTCTACGRLLVPGQTVCACGTSAPLEPTPRRHTFDFGRILPFVPLVGSLLLLYLIANPTIIMYTIMPVLKITAVTFLASAAVALVASDRARRQEWLYAASPFSRLTPASWFVGVLAVWPVFYPAFHHSHYKITHRGRMIFGFITGALFLLALLWILVVSRNQLPQWPVQQISNAEKPAATPTPANQTPLELTPAPQANYPVVIPAEAGPTPTEGIISPFPPVTGDSSPSGNAPAGQSLSNSSLPAPSPAPAPRLPAVQPAAAPPDNSGNSIPLLSVEIIKQGAEQ